MQDINFRIFEKFGADPLYDAEYGMILTYLARAEEEKCMLILWEEDQKIIFKYIALGMRV